jgi:endonuclease/exonuclease/phosphatase family metal-dependent hydrolase
MGSREHLAAVEAELRWSPIVRHACDRTIWGVTFAEAPYGPLVDTTVRVMTWNVWGRFGPWQQRQTGVVHTIRDAAADVVLLQECWVDDTGVDQASLLGSELGLTSSVVGGEPLYGSWGPANAVLSRWPIRDVQMHQLPALAPTDWGGLVQRAVIEGPRRPVLVFNVALDWPPYASSARQYALGHLADTIAADPLFAKAPLVVAGDFNAAPDSDEIRTLLGHRDTVRPGFVLFDAWDRAPDRGAGATWSRSNPWAAPNLLPDRRIDYIFTGWPRRGGVGSAKAARLGGITPHDGVLPSDHYAVIADLRH